MNTAAPSASPVATTSAAPHPASQHPSVGSPGARAGASLEGAAATKRADYWAVWLTLILCVLAFVLSVVFMPSPSETEAAQDTLPICKKPAAGRAEIRKPRRWRCWRPVGTNDQTGKTMSNIVKHEPACRPQMDDRS